MRYSSKKELLDFLSSSENGMNYDAIVVEGYDGVGKGRILNMLSEYYDVTPYRPDYNLWQQYDHRPQDRWKVSGFFWDIYSHFNHHSDKPMLFDRGVISGAVYNHDFNIALNYKKLLKDMRVMHILVTCEEEDYKKFSETRGVESIPYSTYLEYTLNYFKCLALAGVDYIVYDNKFDEEEYVRLSKTCEGCGHYNYGWCRHPSYNCKVDKKSPRCQYSQDKEVQDQNDSKVQCM